MNKKEYNEYLKSEHWKNTKTRFRKSKLKKHCAVCGTKNELNLHHKTYKRLHKENLNDLIFLCKSCHYDVHKFLNENKNKNLYLWNAIKKFKRKHRIKKGCFKKQKILVKNIIPSIIKPPPLILPDGKVSNENNNYIIG